MDIVKTLSDKISQYMRKVTPPPMIKSSSLTDLSMPAESSPAPIVPFMEEAAERPRNLRDESMDRLRNELSRDQVSQEKYSALLNEYFNKHFCHFGIDGLKLLVSHGAKLDFDEGYCGFIEKAIRYCDEPALDLIRENGINLDEFISRGVNYDLRGTLAHMAVNHNNPKLLAYIAKSGMPLDEKDSSGRTPFDIYSGKGFSAEGAVNLKKEFMVTFFEYGIYSKNENQISRGESLPYKMAYLGDFETLRYLSSVGVDVINNLGPVGGAAHGAAIRGDLGMLRDLKDLGANMYQENCAGESVIDLVLRGANTYSIAFLEDSGLDISRKHLTDQLFTESSLFNSDEIHRLRLAGADIYAKKDWRGGLVEICVSENAVDSLKYLKEQNLINLRQNELNSLFFLSCELGNVGVSKILHSLGAEIGASDMRDGYDSDGDFYTSFTSPLEISINNNRQDNVEWIVSLGAKEKIDDVKYDTFIEGKDFYFKNELYLHIFANDAFEVWDGGKYVPIMEKIVRDGHSDIVNIMDSANYDFSKMVVKASGSNDIELLVNIHSAGFNIAEKPELIKNCQKAAINSDAKECLDFLSSIRAKNIFSEKFSSKSEFKPF